ncbi:MAG: TlpA disulfide reductase family protein [bacterium]
MKIFLRIAPLALTFGLILLFSREALLAADPPATIAAIDSALTDSTELAGNVVYVDFWASWCVPCRKSFPWLQGLLERYQKEGLRIVAVNLDKDPKAAAKFLRDMPVTFPIVYDSSGVLAKVYNLEAMPTSFVYDRNGVLRWQHLGFQPTDTLETEEMLFELIREKRTK